MSRAIKDLAGEVADGRLIAVHVGDYNPVYVPFCTAAIIEELAGMSARVEDPFLPFLGP